MTTADYRSEFPVTEKLAFLNHAAVATISKRVRDKVMAWADDMMQFGDLHENDWYDEIETIRGRCAELLGADAAEVAFLKNTSEGIGLVAEGFPWKTGDNVVIVAGEFPANVYPWLHLESRGVEVRQVAPRGPRVDFQDLVRAIDSHTRLLTISFVQFSSGFRSDLAAIGAMCRQRGVDFCVDAIQGLGVFPVDVRSMQIDYLAADGHKWLLAPEGAAVFFVNRDKLEKLRPTGVGWKSVVHHSEYSTIDFRLKTDAGRFESGSLNVSGILGLGASVEMLLEIGIPGVCERVKDVTDYLVEKLQAIDAGIFSSRDKDEWSGIVSFDVPGADLVELHRRCREQSVIISRRDGRLRASPHFYNNHDDIDRLIAVLSGG